MVISIHGIKEEHFIKSGTQADQESTNSDPKEQEFKKMREKLIKEAKKESRTLGDCSIMKNQEKRHFLKVINSVKAPIYGYLKTRVPCSVHSGHCVYYMSWWINAYLPQCWVKTRIWIKMCLNSHFYAQPLACILSKEVTTFKTKFEYTNRCMINA